MYIWSSGASNTSLLRKVVPRTRNLPSLPAEATEDRVCPIGLLTSLSVLYVVYSRPDEFNSEKLSPCLHNFLSFGWFANGPKSTVCARGILRKPVQCYRPYVLSKDQEVESFLRRLARALLLQFVS